MKQINLKKINKMLKVIDPTEIQIIEKNIIESMTDFKIEDIVDDDDAVIMYSDLAKYKSIDKLLPDDRSFKIILIRENEYSGHWTCLLRYTLDEHTVIEFFNSYGLFPSADLKFISSLQNVKLGQDSKHLNYLLQNALNQSYIVIYNKKVFQQWSNNKQAYNTCGRWCVIRILMMIQHNFSLADFINYFEYLNHTYKLNYDSLVSLIIK